jgi:hypothetical protein
MFDPLGVTLKLCASIIQLLNEAKHNKKECGSLKHLVETIRVFLQNLQAEAITNAEKEVLRGLHATQTLSYRSSCNSCTSAAACRHGTVTAVQVLHLPMPQCNFQWSNMAQLTNQVL